MIVLGSFDGAVVVPYHIFPPLYPTAVSLIPEQSKMKLFY
jgi:hypothetical protein